MKLIDVHAHLTDEKFESDWQNVLLTAIESGVTKVISAGCDFSSSQKALELAENNEGVFATAGIHPENLADFEEVLSASNEKQKTISNGEVFGELFCEKAKENLEKEFKKIEKLAGLSFCGFSWGSKTRKVWAKFDWK